MADESPARTRFQALVEAVQQWQPISVNRVAMFIATETQQSYYFWRDELSALLVQEAESGAGAICSTCRHLIRFELTDELFTCPVVNIRIHRDGARVFGCNQHEPFTSTASTNALLPAPCGESLAFAPTRVVPNGEDSGQFAPLGPGAREHLQALQEIARGTPAMFNMTDREYAQRYLDVVRGSSIEEKPNENDTSPPCGNEP